MLTTKGVLFIAPPHALASFSHDLSIYYYDPTLTSRDVDDHDSLVSPQNRLTSIRQHDIGLSFLSLQISLKG
jgi:hypothetical protein